MVTLFTTHRITPERVSFEACAWNFVVFPDISRTAKGMLVMSVDVDLVANTESGWTTIVEDDDAKIQLWSRSGSLWTTAGEDDDMVSKASPLGSNKILLLLNIGTEAVHGVKTGDGFGGLYNHLN
ncbi:hypothetical protein R6Q59_033095 [Mikania micrantha]